MCRRVEHAMERNEFSGKAKKSREKMKTGFHSKTEDGKSDSSRESYAGKPSLGRNAGPLN